MAIEQIKLIREAEEQADLIKKRSNAEAKQMIADAERQRLQMVEQANHQGEENYKKVQEAAGLEAEQSYRDIISKAEEEINHKMSLAESKLESAVSIIIGKVVK